MRTGTASQETIQLQGRTQLIIHFYNTVDTEFMEPVLTLTNSNKYTSLDFGAVRLALWPRL